MNKLLRRLLFLLLVAVVVIGLLKPTSHVYGNNYPGILNEASESGCHCHHCEE